jgi:hypothetical protein
LGPAAASIEGEKRSPAPLRPWKGNLVPISVYSIIRAAVDADPGATHDIICDRVYAATKPTDYGDAYRQCLSWMVSSVAAGRRREKWGAMAPAGPAPGPLSPRPSPTTAAGKPVRNASNSSNYSQAWANVAAHAPDVDEMLNTKVYLGNGEHKLARDCTEEDLDSAIQYYADRIAGDIKTKTELERLRNVLAKSTAGKLGDCTDAELRR